MTQEETRLQLIVDAKKGKRKYGRYLLVLHLVTVTLFAAWIYADINGIIVSGFAGSLNYLIAVTYVNCLAKFYPHYNIFSRALRRLEAGFEEDFDYIKIYEINRYGSSDR